MLSSVVLIVFFFFKQKTADEMRISDWSSDVCSADLQDFWSLRTRSKEEMIAAGRDLARVNASYQHSVEQLETTRAEVGRLEEILRLPSRPEYRFEVDRKSVVWGKGVSVRVSFGGSRIIKKKKK